MPMNMPMPSARGNFFGREDAALNVVFPRRALRQAARPRRGLIDDIGPGRLGGTCFWCGRKEKRRKGKKGRKAGRGEVESTGAYQDSPSNLSIEHES
jgi:hypothetical protein